MPPRLVTPRDPSRSTDGAAGAFVAHLHSRPWVPWQRAAADLIGEQSASGYAYPVVVILVPRQCGKTTFVFDLAQGRALDQPDYRVAYCAQTGHVTTERFSERMAELGSTALAARVQQRRSQGTERMRFPRGSFVKAFPPKVGALRGSTLDLVVVDEAQEIAEDLGVVLDQEIVPTQQNRPRRQLILIGTAGTDRSRYLARHLAAARAGAPGYAVIEYGAADTDDPTDPAVWSRVHPGLAAGLTTADALTTALSVMGASGFEREYLNRWQTTSARVIEAVAWAAIRHRDAIPLASVPPVLAVDVALDRSAAAVVACWPADSGVPVVEVVDYRPGTGWVADRVAQLLAEHQAPAVLADSAGPVLTVVDDLTRAKVEVTTVSTRDLTAAAAGMLDKITDAQVWHRGEPALDAAVAGAGRRQVGDGWAWSRRSSSADVCPLVAASLAVWGHVHRPAAPVRPVAASG